MVVLHRLVVLLAIFAGVGAALARLGVMELRWVATPSAWLRVADTLLLLALALMLEQVLSALRAGRRAAGNQ